MGKGTEQFSSERGPFFPELASERMGRRELGFSLGQHNPAPLRLFTHLGKLERDLRRFAIVIAEHAAEAFPTPNIANSLADFVSRINNPIPETLMISFPLIMGYEFL